MRIIFLSCLLLCGAAAQPLDKEGAERGFVIDLVGGLLSGGSTTPAAPSVETTTFATLYGDLVVGNHLKKRLTYH